MVSIPKAAINEVATLVTDLGYRTTGVIDRIPRGEKRQGLAFVHWPKHGRFPEYILLTDNFVVGTERDRLGNAIIYGRGCFGGGHYWHSDDETKAIRLLRQKLEGVGVELDEIMELHGRKAQIIGAKNSIMAYEGVVLPAPRNESRAEFVLAHRLAHFETPHYTNLYPEDIVNIDPQKIPARIKMYLGGGGSYSIDPIARQMTELHLKQNKL